MKILVVEDYDPIRQAITKGLSEAGFAVDASSDGEEGLWYATSAEYDVIVLDLMLPKIDGLTLLRQIREKGNRAAVLILTARDALDDRVRGLDTGADDYLVKPFAFEELLARVRALVRRRHEVASPIVTVADLEVDTAGRIVRRGGREIELTAREYSILEILTFRAGKVVTRSEIWDHIADFAEDSNSNLIDVYVGYLRKKLEAGGRSRLIHTRRGLGYLLGEGG